MKNFWNFHRVSFNLRAFTYIIPFLFLSLLCIPQGCKKDISSIGLDLKDRDDLLNAVFTDSVTLTAYSVLEDTLNTTGLVAHYLGCLKDNIFGNTTASIFTQLVPLGNNITFGKSPILDSIVFVLRYNGGFYGDTLNPFTVKIYELTEDIIADKTYYQHHSIAYDKSKNLTYSDFHLYPKPNTKVKVDSLLNPHIRIRLKDELGERFFKDYEKLESAETFKKYFKGLYICAESFRNDGSMVNFALSSTLSGIRLYYKEKDGDKYKSKQFAFLINSTDAVRFSHYEHNYNTGEQKFIEQIDSLKSVKEREKLGEKTLYVQSMGGVKTKISFPYIKAFKEKNANGKNIVINKAELVVTDIGEDLHLYPVPNRMGFQAVDSSGKLVIMPDLALGNIAYFGGTYDKNNKEYRFRITRYIQNLIQKENYQPYIYLVAEGAAAYANRLILNGTNPAEASKKLRLEIYYTEY